MKILRLFGTWLRLPPSRRRQWLGYLWGRLFTRLIHARRLKACGRGSIVQRPLFWTPEFIELGQKVFIWPGVRIEAVDIYGNERYGPCIRIGDRCSFQQNCHVTFASTLEIGEGTAIMYGVLVTDIDHEYTEIGVPALQQAIDVKRTRIGDNCFIGAGAKIQAGTRLGNHYIVGTNAVVRGTFPDYCVIAGVPARILKRREPETGTWRKTDAEGRFSV